jgi:hypothetical protein
MTTDEALRVVEARVARVDRRAPEDGGATMTRTELIEGMRKRFAEVRSNFPELVESVRTTSDERILQSILRCGACRKHHISEAEVLAMAEASADMDEFVQKHEPVFIARAPRRCCQWLDAVEADVRVESAAREPS